MTQEAVLVTGDIRRCRIFFEERPERRGVGMTVHFIHPACGAASIAVLAGCVQDAEITGGSCGNVLGTWREFKERARILICSQVSGDEGGSKVISLVPLPDPEPSVLGMQ